jgi:hypothetical protein
VPGFGVVDASGRTPPVDRPCVYPIPNAETDPRAPSGQVPASVKWLNDSLDFVESLSEKHPNARLAHDVVNTHIEAVRALRLLDGPRAQTCISQSTCKTESNSKTEGNVDNSIERIKIPDYWATSERYAVEHVLHTLDILGLCFEPIFIPGATSHGTVTIRGRLVEVTALRGRTHEICIKYSEGLPVPHHAVLVVSRDDDNTVLLPRFGRFLSGRRSRIEEEAKFIDPESVKLMISYQELLSAYLISDTTDQLEERLHVTLAS